MVKFLPISGHSAKKASLRLSALECFPWLWSGCWHSERPRSHRQSTCLPHRCLRPPDGSPVLLSRKWAGLALLVLLKGSTVGLPCDPVAETLHSQHRAQVRPLVGEPDPTCHNWRSERQKERKKGRKKQQRCPPNWTRSTDSVCRHFLQKQAQKPPGGMTPGFSGPKKLFSHKRNWKRRGCIKGTKPRVC